MRFIETTAKLISVWLFVILMAASAAIAQSSAKGVSISLYMNATVVAPGTKPRATITVENRSGAPISLESLGQFTLTLELRDRPHQFCRISECYNAAFFPRGKILANNATATFVANLYDAYWHNSISSIQVAGYPRNLFTGVEPGVYDLSARLSVKADNWTANDPRFFGIKSNVVSPVTISGRK